MSDVGLSFSVLQGMLSGVITQLEDPRKPSNAMTFSLKDIVLGAFSLFYMQCPSFLEHQRQMDSPGSPLLCVMF